MSELFRDTTDGPSATRAPAPAHAIRIAGIDMPFLALAWTLIRIGVAAIPAILIVAIAFAILDNLLTGRPTPPR
jgi:hypothetical protein